MNKIELEQRILSLEQNSSVKNREDSLFRKQLGCGLTRHTCGHEGHLFQFTGKAYTNEDRFNSMFSTSIMGTIEKTDPCRKDVGKFKCKFCDIIMTRKMTAEELKAVDKLSLS